MDLLALVNSKLSIDQTRRAKHNGRKLPIHELLYAKANIEKLRLRTAFNSMDYNGLAPSIGARQSSIANNLSYKNSLDSNLSKTSSCDQEFPRKGSRWLSSVRFKYKPGYRLCDLL